MTWKRNFLDRTKELRRLEQWLEKYGFTAKPQVVLLYADNLFMYYGYADGEYGHVSSTYALACSLQGSGNQPLVTIDDYPSSVFYNAHTGRLAMKSDRGALFSGDVSSVGDFDREAAWTGIDDFVSSSFIGIDVDGNPMYERRSSASPFVSLTTSGPILNSSSDSSFFDSEERNLFFMFKGNLVKMVSASRHEVDSGILEFIKTAE